MNYKRICDLSSDRYAKASKRARELGRGSQANRFAVAAGKALTNELRNFKFDITNKDDKELLQSVGIPASEFKNIDADNDNRISTEDVIDWATLMGEPESIVEDLKETVSEIVEESKVNEPESESFNFNVDEILKRYKEVLDEAKKYYTINNSGYIFDGVDVFTSYDADRYKALPEDMDDSKMIQTIKDAIKLAEKSSVDAPYLAYVRFDYCGMDGAEQYIVHYSLWANGDGTFRLEENDEFTAKGYSIYYWDASDITFLCLNGLPIDWNFGGDHTIEDFKNKIETFEENSYTGKETDFRTCLDYFMKECAEFATRRDWESWINDITYKKDGDVYTYQYTVYGDKVDVVTVKDSENPQKKDFYFRSSNGWLYWACLCKELNLYIVYNVHAGWLPVFYVQAPEDWMWELADEFDVMIGDIQSPQLTLMK